MNWLDNLLFIVHITRSLSTSVYISSSVLSRSGYSRQISDLVLLSLEIHSFVEIVNISLVKVLSVVLVSRDSVVSGGSFGLRSDWSYDWLVISGSSLASVDLHLLSFGVHCWLNITFSYGKLSRNINIQISAELLSVDLFFVLHSLSVHWSLYMFSSNHWSLDHSLSDDWLLNDSSGDHFLIQDLSVDLRSGSDLLGLSDDWLGIINFLVI